MERFSIGFISLASTGDNEIEYLFLIVLEYVRLCSPLDVLLRIQDPTVNGGGFLPVTNVFYFVKQSHLFAVSVAVPHRAAEVRCAMSSSL